MFRPIRLTMAKGSIKATVVDVVGMWEWARTAPHEQYFVPTKNSCVAEWHIPY